MYNCLTANDLAMYMLSHQFADTVNCRGLSELHFPTRFHRLCAVYMYCWATISARIDGWVIWTWFLSFVGMIRVKRPNRKPRWSKPLKIQNRPLWMLPLEILMAMGLTHTMRTRSLRVKKPVSSSSSPWLLLLSQQKSCDADEKLYGNVDAPFICQTLVDADSHWYSVL